MSTAVAEIQTNLPVENATQQGVSPMVQMFASGQYDVEQIEKLIELQERFEANEAKKAYHAAMSRSRLEMGSASKTGKNNHLHTTYPTLDDLIRGASPALANNGFSFSWDLEQSDGQVKATCKIVHAMGHQESTPVTMPITPGLKSRDGKVVVNDSQSVGIAITYAKRYSFSALVGIATEDHDGGRPPQNSHPRPEPTFTPEQKKRFDEAIAESKAATIYTMSRLAGNSKAWKDLVGSGGKGNTSKVREAVRKLEAQGRDMCEQAGIKINECFKADQEVGAIEEMELYTGRELESVLLFCEKPAAEWAYELSKNTETE